MFSFSFSLYSSVYRQGIKPPVLVFVQSIERAKQLFHELVYDGLCVDVIHAERTQAQVNPHPPLDSPF